MKQAYLAVRVQQGHKREAMLEGIEALGYKLVTHPTLLVYPDEALIVTWNIHARANDLQVVQQAGGAVLVVENPYIKYDKQGREYLAIGKGGHNGSGKTPEPSEERTRRFDIRLEDWKTGKHVLVIGQRGIGSPEMRSPPRWGEIVTEQVRAATTRDVILRPHPGQTNIKQIPPLDEQLEGAHCVVMWASNCATTALAKGIPVFYNAPHCVLHKACNPMLDIENPYKGRRWPAFMDLAAAQWNLDEVRSGEAFQCLINCS